MRFLFAARMMMVSDDCLVECKIDDDSDEDGGGGGGGGEQINTPPPPPEFASKAPTPAPKAPTPPATPAAPTPTCHPPTRDPYGINKHLKVLFSLTVELKVLENLYKRQYLEAVQLQGRNAAPN